MTGILWIWLLKEGSIDLFFNKYQFIKEVNKPVFFGLFHYHPSISAN